MTLPSPWRLTGCYRHLEAALAGCWWSRPAAATGSGALVRDALVQQMPPVLLATARRDVAEQLAGLGAPPSRVAHQYLAAGLPSRAVPFVLRTVESAGALGAYRDALTWSTLCASTPARRMSRGCWPGAVIC